MLLPAAQVASHLLGVAGQLPARPPHHAVGGPRHRWWDAVGVSGQALERASQQLLGLLLALPLTPATATATMTAGE